MEGIIETVMLLSAGAVAVPLALLAIVTWFLHFFVALRAPPTARATWTVVPAFVAVAILLATLAPPDRAWALLLGTAVASLVAFLWWHSEFRTAWIESADVLPEGVELANDNWRAGLILAIGVIGLLLIRGLYQMVAEGRL
ncbi:hypothetical protein E2493_13665 [Sphingomonas parva]|uniref:Transmembrane protein n=1 Tax=Sphingomonas parva TaxID=2555898 RepID=A0A4Y8ZNW0_9SPHN|nr:hypothetical protein [Sphingomonas parva]TFI57691.1 hypothetical protein E2493_13665 [Sphingomonas parva]